MSNQKFDELRACLLLHQLTSKRRDITSLLISGIRPTQLVSQIKEDNLFGKAESIKKFENSRRPEKEMERAQKHSARMVTILDEDYPWLLRETSDPPILFFMKGTLTEEPSIAVVGTRYPNLYGSEQALRFSRDLMESGVTICSGLAKGIDQAAHKGALAIPFGRTLGVLGCGLDIDYPKGSQKLKAEMIERGAVISEFNFGAEPFAGHFPRRNRIIAGLTCGTLVIQANERSGSLITARLALEEGREVFAVPGNLNDSQSKGAHKLIKEGATLVESYEDILNAIRSFLDCRPAADRKLQQHDPQIISMDLFEEAAAVEDAQKTSPNWIMKLLEEDSLSYDDLVVRNGGQLNEVARELLQLEMTGKVRKTTQGVYELVCDDKSK